MTTRVLLGFVCLGAIGAAAWVGQRAEEPPAQRWTEVAPGVLRSPGSPASYALVAEDAALLIDAAASPDGLKAHGIKSIAKVLLTHHHRDSAAYAARYRADKVPVLAPKASAEWLTAEGVTKYWKESLPLR